MATSNRGRGRPYGQDASERHKDLQPKRKPIPKSIEELSQYLHSLNEQNVEIHGFEFANMVHMFSGNEIKLSGVVDLIFNTACAHRDYSTLGAKVCMFIICGEVDERIGTQFRQKLLLRFQSEVARMREIRNGSIEKWLGIFAFLCEVYSQVTVSGMPIQIVGKAIIQNIEIMVNDSDVIDDEIDCICSKLKTCGKSLEDQFPNKLKNILTSLRKHVISKKSSCQRRCDIMEIIELKHLGWNDSTRSLDEFYVDARADAVVEDEINA